MKMNRSLLRVEQLERRENPAATSIGVAIDVLLPSPPEAQFLEGYTGNLENDQFPQPPVPVLQGPDIVVGASGTGSLLVRNFSSRAQRTEATSVRLTVFPGCAEAATLGCGI